MLSLFSVKFDLGDISYEVQEAVKKIRSIRSRIVSDFPAHSKARLSQ